MADNDKKHQTDDIASLEGNAQVLDENDENFNDDVDIDDIQKQLMEYINIDEFENKTAETKEEKQEEILTINNLQKPQAEGQAVNEHVQSSEDSMEINEIISMNEDVTQEMIEQAENNLKSLNGNPENAKQHTENFDTNNNIVLDYLSSKGRPKSVEGYKKYIVYIDPDNEEYMNSLTLQERKDIINSILNGENLKAKRMKTARRNKDFLFQALIVFFCILIGFPLLYKFTNFCLTATINNYKEAQTNFEKLYKETGKIKVKKEFGLH